MKNIPEKSIKILIEARKEFAAKGFYNASVDVIAANAGVGKGTVYRHFGDKDSLILAVTKYSFDNVVDEIKKLPKCQTFKDEITNIFKAFTEIAFKSKDILPIFFHTISKMSIQQREKILINYFKTLIDHNKELTVNAVKNNEIDNSINIDHLSFLIWECSNSIMKNIVLFNKTEEEITNYNNFVIDLIFKGLEKKGEFNA